MKQPVMIGSTAMHLVSPIPFYGRYAQDLDLMSDVGSAVYYLNQRKVNPSIIARRNPSRFILRHRTENAWAVSFDVDCGSTSLFVDLVNKNPFSAPRGIAGFEYPPISVLTLIKKSHIVLDRNWDKHIVDYHFLKSQCKDPFTTKELEAYELRRKEAIAWSGARKPKLNMSNDKFFAMSEKKVNRIYDHDSLHQAVAYYDVPMFEKLKTDTSQAMISREKFEKLSHEDQLRTVREECYVIALERWMIPCQISYDEYPDIWPYDDEYNQKCYHNALRKVSTTLTSGWFREFALENYLLLNSPEVDFVSKFIEARSQFKIKRA